MRFGVSTFVTDEGIGPAELGRALEERGFAALYIAEHTHIPVSRETPYPGGGDLPRVYYRTLDPIVVLTAAAVVTERLTLGTGIALIPQRDPIVFAKEIASLDLVSGGRAAVGIGGGWNREEMRDHGTDPKTRMDLMRERVLAMREIWTKDEAEFHGEHVDFDPMFSWPKPVRTPPIMVGGWGPKTFDRVLEYGDGWLPIAGEVDRLAKGVKELRERAGRHVPVTVYATPAKREVVDKVIAAGVDEILLFLPTKPADETLRRLDTMADLIAD
ncbi:LLM class F420-dependent oxidoreductase [Actinoallomurus sp. CA-150999]|uniref:LLM class F420-dependent oxidoreductase n=1 Tax=Actinoallomurus sp. CA-150999 TaxID=3239887 RepID=UPI003D903F87